MLLRLLRSLSRNRVAVPTSDSSPPPDEQSSAEACIRAGRELERTGQLGAALERYRQCAAVFPDAVNAQLAQAAVLATLWRVEECVVALERALSLAPGASELWSDYLLWKHLTAEVDALELAQLHRRFGELIASTVAERPARRVAAAGRSGRLRIGYVSRNFLRHSVAFFVEPVIAHHDRARFEVFCYYTHSVVDDTTERIAKLADVWRHLPEADDATLAARVESDAIDVLVDLAGHTKRNRLGVFARRPAPLQVTWIGYPDTTGLTAIDLRISDAIADPAPESDARHTERLLRLEPCFLCYRPPEDAPPVTSRSDSQRVRFGSFNMLAKVNARAVGVWARILREVPGSTMILKSSALAHAETREGVLGVFEAHGVARERLDLRGWEDERAHHLAAYGEVDVALDTFPYNGTTTTCEALWMGVPVVTLAGNVHMSRVGATLLACVGLSELVAQNEDEYVSAAVALARDAARRVRLRETMRSRLEASPLLDGERFTRRLEARLVEAWRAH